MICCSLEIFQKNQQSVFKSTLGSKELIDSSRSSQKYLAKESHQISKNIEGMEISIPMGGWGTGWKFPFILYISYSDGFHQGHLAPDASFVYDVMQVEREGGGKIDMEI